MLFGAGFVRGSATAKLPAAYLTSRIVCPPTRLYKDSEELACAGMSACYALLSDSGVMTPKEGFPKVK